MTKAIFYGCALAVALTSLNAGCQTGDVGSRKFAVVGGSYHAGDPAVVAVLTHDASGTVTSFCSGLVVSPRVVMTAAHCIDSGASLRVYFGSEPFGFFDSTYIDTIDVVDTVLHPEFVSTGRPYYEDWDVGAVALAEPAPASFVPINRVPLEPQVGDMMRLVGFGCSRCGQQDQGVKREATTPLRRVDEMQAYYGDGMVSTCGGDSGMAALMQVSGREVAVSIHSGGEVMDCTGPATGFRTDAFAEAILDPFIRTYNDAGCGSDGLCAEGCATADPDCPCRADGFCGDCPVPSADEDCMMADAAVDAQPVEDSSVPAPDAAPADAGAESQPPGETGPADPAPTTRSSRRGCAAGGESEPSLLVWGFVLLLVWRRPRRRQRRGSRLVD